MRERKTNHILLYLACEHMLFGVKQLQRKIESHTKERMMHKG